MQTQQWPLTAAATQTLLDLQLSSAPGGGKLETLAPPITLALQELIVRGAYRIHRDLAFSELAERGLAEGLETRWWITASGEAWAQIAGQHVQRLRDLLWESEADPQTASRAAVAAGALVLLAGTACRPGAAAPVLPPPRRRPGLRLPQWRRRGL